MPKISVLKSILVFIVILIMTGVSYGGLKIWKDMAKTENQTEQNLINKNLVSGKISNFSGKGWLLIYDPKAEFGLHGAGFDPLVWYLVVKDVQWQGATESPKSTLKLMFTDSSKCILPENEFGSAKEESCLKKVDVKWGYGDRVRVTGERNGDFVKVEIMEVVSVLPLDPLDFLPAGSLGRPVRRSAFRLDG